MYPVKQSTALTVPFFAHDASGDGVTGLADGGFTKRISKNGGAFAAMTVTISEMENGWYSFPLSTSHSDTLGLLTLSFSHASCKRVNLQFRVSARILDDLASQTSVDTVDDFLDTEVAAIKAKTDQLAFTTANKVDATIQAADDLAQAAADKVWSTGTRALTDKAGFSLSSAGIQAIWDALTSALTTANTIGKLLVDNINATISSRSSFNAASDTVTLANGGITAAKFGAGAIDAAALAADAVQEIWDAATSGLTTAGSVGKLLTDNINATIGSRSSHAAADIWAAGTRTITGTAAGALAAASFSAGAIDAASLATDAGQEIADRVLARSIAGGADGGRTVTSALRRLRNKVSIAAGTMTVTTEDDSTTDHTAAVTTTAGNPISAIDPA